tara:strand:+ start:109 stop:1011 length:903 start_codon:yes stop_codon:yes gene_type:complete
MIRNIIVVLLFPFLVSAQSAFISGNDTVCDNANSPAEVKIDFTGATSPFTFVYAINGISEPSITTNINPYIIHANEEGTYTLTSFVNGLGLISGSASVTLIPAPIAIIHLNPDTLSVIYPIANFVSQSTGNIVSWDWNFGDNTLNINTENPSHVYSDSSAIFQATLIIQDINECLDTVSKIVFMINDEKDESHWMWIPNSFTPNNEEPNNNFCIEFNSIQQETFIFKVYNSQGDMMYQSIIPDNLRCCRNPPNCSEKGGWNGKHYLTNKDLPSDTYVYELFYKEYKGWKHSEYGSIILIR